MKEIEVDHCLSRGQAISVIALAVGLLGMPLHAAEALSSKPVTFIVPLAPGGPNGIEARLYAGRMNSLLSHQFLVDYKPGAGGTIGAGYVAKAAPDGHTLLLTGGSFSAFPALYKNLPFDTTKDFAHVSLMSLKHFVLVVPPSFPAATVAAYVAYAKDNPDKVNFATTGAGGSVHLAGAWLHNLIDAKPTFVHYKGTTPATTDLVSGRVQMGAFGLQPALLLIKSGKVKALAVMGSRRSKLLPDLATIGETLPGYSFESYIGFSAPGATPQAIVRQLHEGFVQAIKTPEIIKALEAQGSVPVGSTPAEFSKMLQTETARWRKVVRDNAITLAQ